MFLQRPKPFNDETLESFFIRVANKNGYRDIHRFLLATKKFLQEINHRMFSTFPTDITLINPCSSKNHSTARTHSLLKLSQLTFNEPSELLGLAINRSSIKFSPDSSALIRGSEVFPRYILRTKQIPCCPLCLSEHGYANYLWHLSGYDYCHKHKIKLIHECPCGTIYDYRKAGLSGICIDCGKPLALDKSKGDEDKIAIASWLAGNDVPPLPSVPASHRWGILYWWQNITEANDVKSLLLFWHHWPQSFDAIIDERIQFNLDYAVVERNQLRLKDLLGSLFYSSINLPSRDLKSNFILKQLFDYLEKHLWEDLGLLAELRINALDACLLLNCSIDQIASMVQQKLLTPNCRINNKVPLNVSSYIFNLGDVYCLWLSEFQTPECNRSHYISRW
ncbi:TniQ family protein [Shewanella subflava]|uniref:TniQ family protein n=1 Tax=Shewanella subflava TaxID=2986476 RepID=A0ABT3I987_9GAMM|nr:TniQ family protein [Shewanella subflava]MCW3172626.1 TniQ family protein [Shewanella subflava]